MKKKVFISGPMTGYQNYNRRAFFEKETELREKGYRVLNPARIAVMEDGTWEHYMRLSIAMLMEADIICVIDGWSGSQGSTLEVSIGTSLGMEVMCDN